MYLELIRFLTALFLITSLYWTLIPRSGRELYLLVVSAGFVVLLSPTYACYYFLNITAVYLAGEHLQERRRYYPLLFKVVLSWLVVNLLFFKYVNQVILLILGDTGLIAGYRPPEILFPIGISYLSFRLIHYIMEAYRCNLPRTTLRSFATYLLFFPTFLSGPVERFQKFHPQSSAPGALEPENITTGLYRILLGIFRKFIIADTVAKLVMPVLHNPSEHSPLIILICIYGLIFRIYMDLAGYTDMAIGTAKLFGFEIMENFNRPLTQRNIGLYWRNWHISVYTWIRDYFFFPLFGYRSSPMKIYAGSFLIVFLFMVWHAGTLGYAAAGIYHGVGIVVWQIFSGYVKRRPHLRKLMALPFFHYLFIFMTYNFISFGVLLYTFEKTQILLILGALY